MIFAYDKVYLDKFQKNMGAMFDYAIHDCGVELVQFTDMYVNSRLSKLQAHGDILALIGMSGAEMAIEVIDPGYDKEEDFPMPGSRNGRSQVYWTGWVLAYYQWYRNKEFKSIIKEIPIESIYNLYNPYHEMDISQIVDKLNELSMASRVNSYLKAFREKAGLSQSQLSDITGIPVKTIQQYEQRRKDINRAQADYVIKLSMALRCNPNDLLENMGVTDRINSLK